MSGVDKLIGIAGRRSEEALLAWRQLRAQCDEAIRKLSLLKQYRERYRDLMRAALAEGVPAPAMLTYLDFIKQIEQVALRQESDVGNLESACAQYWQELVAARREKRMYEILGERAAAEEARHALRRRQKEVDELLQRAAKIDEKRNFGI
ncbi:MAG TPA: flagellar export protein FliJ [Stellaceae bacterium]|nr:flagellar export protein FliJ [Stellaceae bacterium]